MDLIHGRSLVVSAEKESTTILFLVLNTFGSVVFSTCGAGGSGMDGADGYKYAIDT